MKKYFQGVTDYAELRDQYKTLVKTMHPDCGGDTAAFQDMQNEYEDLAKTFGRDKKSAREDMANAWGLVRGMLVIFFGPGMSSYHYAVTEATKEGAKLVRIGEPVEGVEYFDIYDTVDEIDTVINMSTRDLKKGSFGRVEPLSKKFGIGYYYDDVDNTTFTDDEIKAAELRALNVAKYGELAKADRQRKADEAARLEREAEERIINEWRTRLEIIPEGATDAKKKTILKRNVKAMFNYYFPGVKVSVKDTSKIWCEDSRIEWVDGPSVEEVENIDAFDYFRACGYVAASPYEDYGHTERRTTLAKFRKMFGAFSDDTIDYDRTLSDDYDKKVDAALDAVEWEGRDNGKITCDSGSAAITWAQIDSILEALGVVSGSKCSDEIRKHCVRQDCGVDAQGHSLMRVYRSNLYRIFAKYVKFEAVKAETKIDEPVDDNVEAMGAAPEGLELIDIDGGVAVTGNTYAFRKAIKAHGAKWHKANGRWEATTAEAVQSLREWFGQSETASTTDDSKQDEPQTTTADNEREADTFRAFIDMVQTFAEVFHICTEIKPESHESEPQAETATTDDNEPQAERVTIIFTPEDCPDLDELRDIEPQTTDDQRQPLSDEEAAKVRQIFTRYAQTVDGLTEDNEHTGAVFTQGMALLLILSGSQVFAVNEMLNQLSDISKAHTKRGHITAEEVAKRDDIARTFCRYAVEYAGADLAAILFGSYMVQTVREGMRGAA